MGEKSGKILSDEEGASTRGIEFESGEDVGRVYHNLNNLLMGIVVNAQLLKEENVDSQNLRKFELIHSSAMQAQELVSRLQVISQDEDVGDANPVVSDVGSTPVDRARILVVDDMEAVGLTLAEVFRGSHDTTAVLRGGEALEEFGKGYDVAMIDLDIPDIPGERLAFEFRQIDPTVGIILMTGWQIQEKDPKFSPFDFFLRKPLKGVDEIRDVVARAVKLHEKRVGENNQRGSS